MMAREVTTAMSLLWALAGGCVAARPAGGLDEHRLETRARECLSAAVRYKANPVVRLEAIEALESYGREDVLPWIRLGLLDDHPAVRFAACVAVGRLRDRVAMQAVRERLDDQDPHVRLAALFALHRLGDTSRTGRMAGYLLDDEDPGVRRNAALLLGMLDEKGAIKLLARSMKDGDPGVRHHALEAMARLGNEEARQELIFMTNAGVGPSQEVFALGALAQTGERRYRDAFLYKLGTAAHLETKLAAARALGALGDDQGYDVALGALRTNRPRFRDPDDPPAAQVLRAKQMAAAALGAIGRVEALSPLEAMLGGGAGSACPGFRGACDTGDPRGEPAGEGMAPSAVTCREVGGSMRWLVFAIVAAAAVTLQSALGPYVQIAGVRPDWLVVLVVFFALHARPRDAAIGAWLVGFGADLLSIERLGLMALSYMLVALFVASIRDYLFCQRGETHFVVTLLACGLLQLAWLVYRRCLYDPIDSLVADLLFGVVGVSVYTALWGMLIHRALIVLSGAWGIPRPRYSHAGLTQAVSGRV